MGADAGVAALPGGPAAASTEAEAIHDRAIVIDGCSFFFEGNNAMLREGGSTAAMYTVALPMDDPPEAVARVRDYHATVRRDPDSSVIRTVQDLRDAKAAGRHGVIIGCQNARLMGTDLAWLDVFWQLGLRNLQLTYNERNHVGDGCLEPEDAGLSHLGRRVVRKANGLGLTVDLSHASPRTCLEAIETSERPCIISHAGVATLVPGPRSISDEVMRELAGAGGVMGVTTFPRVNWRGGPRRPSLDDFLDAVDHVVELLGIDHVGVGTDYAAAPGAYPKWVTRYLAETYAPYRDGAEDSRPGLKEVLGGIDIHDEQLEGFAGIHHLPRLTEGLMRRGYDEESIHKVLGSNFVRVFEQTWA
jgi:membrane dipeptidase